MDLLEAERKECGTRQEVKCTDHSLKNIPDFIYSTHLQTLNTTNILNLLKFRCDKIGDWGLYCFFWNRKTIKAKVADPQVFYELLTLMSKYDVSYECSLLKKGNSLYLYTPSSGYIQNNWQSVWYKQIESLFVESTSTLVSARPANGVIS